MVEQLLAVPQEGLPKVKGGANGRAGSQPVVVRTVEDGEPELVEQVLWHGVVVGHGVLLVVLVGVACGAPQSADLTLLPCPQSLG
jgi:hypothetical protein